MDAPERVIPIGPATAPEVGSGWTSWGERTFWALLFVVWPFVYHPDYLLRGFLSPERLAAIDPASNLAARAVATFALVMLGTALLLLRSPHGLRDLPRLVRRWPLPYQVLLALVVLVLVSTAFSNLAPDFILLGSESRWDGTLITASWLLLALVAAGLAQIGSVPSSAVRVTALVGGVAAAAFILAQALGFEPLNLLPGPQVASFTPEGPFGHDARTTVYLGMMILLLVAPPLRRGSLSIVHLAVATPLLAGMAAGGGRAAIAAMILVWIGLGLYLLATVRGRALRQYGVVTLLAVVVGATLLFATPWGRSRIDRTLEAFATGDDAVTHRVIFWRTGFETLAEYPLWGVGPSGFAFTIFDRVTEREAASLVSEHIGFVPEEGTYLLDGEAVVYRLPETDQVTFRRFRMSKAHMYPLDFALGHGLPAALVLVAVAALILLRTLRSRDPFAFGVGVAFALYLLFGLAWFASVSLDPIVWGLLGAGLGYASSSAGRTDAPEVASG